MSGRNRCSQSINLRLPHSLLERLKVAAQARQPAVGYQTLIRELLEQSLEQSEQPLIGSVGSSGPTDSVDANNLPESPTHPIGQTSQPSQAGQTNPTTSTVLTVTPTILPIPLSELPQPREVPDLVSDEVSDEVSRPTRSIDFDVVTLQSSRTIPPPSHGLDDSELDAILAGL